MESSPCSFNKPEEPDWMVAGYWFQTFTAEATSFKYESYVIRMTK